MRTMQMKYRRGGVPAACSTSPRKFPARRALSPFSHHSPVVDNGRTPEGSRVTGSQRRARREAGINIAAISGTGPMTRSEPPLGLIEIDLGRVSASGRRRAHSYRAPRRNLAAHGILIFSDTGSRYRLRFSVSRPSPAADFAYFRGGISVCPISDIRRSSLLPPP